MKKTDELKKVEFLVTLLTVAGFRIKKSDYFKVVDGAWLQMTGQEYRYVATGVAHIKEWLPQRRTLTLSDGAVVEVYAPVLVQGQAKGHEITLTPADVETIKTMAVLF